MIMRDLDLLMKRMTRIAQGKPDFEFQQIHADYSEQTTPERVYTTVARDLVRQGNFLSFISHAGIGLSRNPNFSNPPSWVPDWSTDAQASLLPHEPTHSKPRQTAANDGDSEQEPEQLSGADSFVCDGARACFTSRPPSPAGSLT